MRYIILECVLWFIALCVSLAIMIDSAQGELPWLVYMASGLCFMLACVKLPMCVEIALRHYQRVKRMHRF